MSKAFVGWSNQIAFVILLFLSGVSLAQDVTLVPGVTDSGEYGWQWGSNANRDVVTAVFQSTGTDLELSVSGYDINRGDEVSVSLNGLVIGYLARGSRNALNSGSTYPIEFAHQISGLNTVEFRQSRSGWKWGVTNLLVSEVLPPPPAQADVFLTPNIAETGQFGWKWGNNANREEVTVQFQNTGEDALLSVTGYDIDRGDEVSVLLNGAALTFLPDGVNNGFSSPFIVEISANEQLSGANTVVFQQSRPGWKWGVTNLVLEVRGPNQAPQASNDTATVTEGGSVTINVLGNDNDSDGSLNAGSVEITSPATNGSLSVQSNGSVVYTQDGELAASDSFTYTVEDEDGGLSNEATVVVSLSAIPNQAPQASNDTATVAEGDSVTINVLDNDSDTDGSLNAGSIEITSLATNGSVSVQSNGSVVYTHGGNTAASDSFSYTVLDNEGTNSNIATVLVTITSVITNQPPQANNESVQVLSGASLTIDILANDSDADGSLDLSSVSIVEQPQNSSSLVVLADGRLTYTNSGNGVSSDSLKYTVRDNEGEISNVATVSISVLPVIEGGSVTAFHRDGQSFLTWTETGSGDGYHVYRHDSPITAANLSSARKLTGKWGPLGSDTSVNLHGGPNVPDNFVISDLGSPLSDDTALFVYTTQAGDSAAAYYAVTSVTGGGTEVINSVLSTSTALSESVSSPSDVLTVSVNQGKGRIYTQYMDYANWNPTFNGYAYNYTVALPASYDSSIAYPLMLELHAYYETFKPLSESEFQWPVITVLPHDPGPPVGALHSWWYGYARDHNYDTDGAIPGAGAIANFTEQRVMRTVAEIINSPEFNVDENRIHAYGNSMGASGSFSLALRYGSILSGVYANQPMTNYKSSPTFDSELVQLWGNKSDNLPIVNGGLYSEGIQIYGLNGIQNMGVWDWMDHHKQVVERRGDDFAFLMTFHGKQDQIIDWSTQGKPTVQAFTDAKVGFSAVNSGAAGHTWGGFVAVNVSLFGFGYDNDFAWKYPLNLSFPAITNATDSGNVVPSNTGDDAYNMNIEWATPHTTFAPSIVDMPKRYEISLRSTSIGQTASITPRRTQQFDPDPGAECSWVTINNNTGQQISTGSATVDIDSLLTVDSVSIGTGAGTRLNIVCP